MKELAIAMLIIWYVSCYGCETFGIPEPEIKIDVRACPETTGGEHGKIHRRGTDVHSEQDL